MILPSKAKATKINLANLPIILVVFISILSLTYLLASFNKYLQNSDDLSNSNSENTDTLTSLAQQETAEVIGPDSNDQHKSSTTISLEGTWFEQIELFAREAFQDKIPQEQEEPSKPSDNTISQNQEPVPEPTPEPQQPEPAPEPPPSPSSCPISTHPYGCVPCECPSQYCRCEEGSSSGYKGWSCQNNNPTNIRHSSERINLITQMGGTAPCGQKGGFMTFATYNIGIPSTKAYIRAINAGLHSMYPECGDCTLTYFFARYAANSAYALKIAETMGGSVTIDTKLNWIVANRLDDFVNAIQHREGFFTQQGLL